MKEDSNIKGHASALMTILIWGTTFISTKILLMDFMPIEILFYRFSIGLFVLFIAYPHRLKGTNKKQEFMFMAAGLCGVMMYYLLENIALTFTQASNVGVITSTTVFFTALLANYVLGEKLKANFFIGFFASIVGIFLIGFNGSAILKLNPIGDLLALLAAMVWSVYCILIRKISQFSYNTIQTTRRIFLYGLMFMMIALYPLHFEWRLERFLKPVNIFNILFLGIGASALCFVTWNLAVKLLGPVKTSVYIYLIPVITVVTSIIVLNERITLISAVGTALILIGLYISEKKLR